MRAVMFFRMLGAGREIERRREFRRHYEQCRVAAFPNMDERGRKESLQYYWDGSLSEIERAGRDEAIEQVQEDAKKTWVPTREALKFFRRNHGG